MYLLGLLTSKVANEVLGFINPTLNYQKKDMESLPLILSNHSGNICYKVEENVEISKWDWDLQETSYDFEINPLIVYANGINTSLKDIYDEFKKDVGNKFISYKDNLQKINKYFIELYGLEKELSFEVSNEDIKILKLDKKRI